jgi:hypothetical protein
VEIPGLHSPDLHIPGIKTKLHYNYQYRLPERFKCGNNHLQVSSAEGITKSLHACCKSFGGSSRRGRTSTCSYPWASRQAHTPSTKAMVIRRANAGNSNHCYARIFSCPHKMIKLTYWSPSLAKQGKFETRNLRLLCNMSNKTCSWGMSQHSIHFIQSSFRENSAFGSGSFLSTNKPVYIYLRAYK